MRRLILMVITTIFMFGYDFGDVIRTKFENIDKSKTCMVMVGKTKCIWCESMAPSIKEIKEKYPNLIIYYINSDKDPLGAINNNIIELPVQILYKNGKEVYRHIGYANQNTMLEFLKEYGLIKE